jgi:transposase
MHATLIAMDTSKTLFTLHGTDAAGQTVLRQELKRSQLERFFRKLAPTEVVMEACGGSHHWGRVLGELGHSVRLIPAQHVKPFVKRGKNDRIDAQAIAEAARRPGLHPVPVKTAAAQADALALTLRDQAVRQRTQLVNALRGHAAEFGITAARNISHVRPLLERIAAETTLPERARRLLARLGEQIARLDAEIGDLDAEIAAMHQANPLSQRLQAIPGIGPISAISFALIADPARFANNRQFAAWIGLTPQEHSTAGRQRLGGITRAGHERLRQLLVLGATAVIKAVLKTPGHRWATPWLTGLLARRPRKVVAVALANKMARIIWAMLTSGEAYRPAQAG